MIIASLVTSFVFIKVYNGSVLLYSENEEEEEEEDSPSIEGVP